MSRARTLLRAAPWWALGLLLLLLAWHLLATRLGPLLMATPAQTWQGLLRLLGSADFAGHAAASLARVVLSVGLGIAVGLLLALLAAGSERLRLLLEPLRWLLMSVPPVVMVVLAMLWLGMGTAMVVAIAILLLSPVVYSNTLRGMHLVDHGLLDLARVYRFGRWRKLRHIVLPAMSIPLCSVLHVACCSGIRLVVMAEVIGAANGAGFAIANARGSLDSATVYAWVLLVVLMVAAVECLLLRPLQRHLTRWQRLAPRHAGRSEQHA